MIANDPDGASDMVRRLIGPAGPELSCDECFDLLDVYVELEHGGGDAAAAMPAMRTHLLGCPACRDDRDSLRALLDLPVAWSRLITSKLVHLAQPCQHLAPPGGLELLDGGDATWNISKQQKPELISQLGSMFSAPAR